MPNLLWPLWGPLEGSLFTMEPFGPLLPVPQLLGLVHVWPLDSPEDLTSSFFFSRVEPWVPVFCHSNCTLFLIAITTRADRLLHIADNIIPNLTNRAIISCPLSCPHPLTVLGSITLAALHSQLHIRLPMKSVAFFISAFAANGSRNLNPDSQSTQ